ncbi:MAG TPA: TylF/MycF/NovP-related O-methyltransferase [Polyangiaceae bacterium]|nr:TylF/MycF/NovP-related O-methyltransferase [Polyangiaceae bacterium]
MVAPTYMRIDALDPLPYSESWPSLRSASGRVDVHSLAAFWILESKLSGPYLEFGVGAGRSAIAAIRANRRYNPETVARFFLFDSFEGLPPLTGKDTGSLQFKGGDYAFSRASVIQKLTEHEAYDANRVELVSGFYEHSLPRFDTSRFDGRKVAIVHVDVDLYESAAIVLRFVTPHLQAGTMLLFDDWNTFVADNRRGERAACREWLAENPTLSIESYVKYGWHGEGFIVHLT